MTLTDIERRDAIRLLAVCCLPVEHADQVARAWLPNLTTRQRMTHMYGLRIIANRIRTQRDASGHPPEQLIAGLQAEIELAIDVALLTDEQAGAAHKAYEALTGQGLSRDHAAEVVDRLVTP
jgi:hypothetical protein